MASNPQEDVMKRLMGIKDARGQVGALARGKNMYPGGNAARTGGGPNIGRPAMGGNVPGKEDAINAIRKKMMELQGAAGQTPQSAPQQAQARAQDQMMKQRAVMQNQAGGNAPNANAAAPAQANAQARMQDQKAKESAMQAQQGMQQNAATATTALSSDKAAKLADVSMQAAARRRIQGSAKKSDLESKLKQQASQR